ncbi:MAG: tyrosine-protein phosphatase [Acidobacteria bacterium]|nr:tyrosine-protein phosphatase [Acidobacteriota bacterium]
MFRRARAAAFVLALAAVFASAPAGAQEAAHAPVREGREASGAEEAYAELPNFHRVNAHLYRGGQPQAGGLAKLASMGVKTILNLRDDDSRAVEEGREAAALGLRYFNIPISRAGRPSRERIEELMALVDAPENQPVFVHCKRGADRTGAFVAAYRITHDGWTGERALAEAESFGMGFWQHGKRDFINDFYRDHAAKQAESHSSH